VTVQSDRGTRISEGSTRTIALRGHVVSCLRDPSLFTRSEAILDIEDGLVVMGDGVIQAVGPYDATSPLLPHSAIVREYPGSLIAPGFVDAHVHYAQTPMIASYGSSLLEWLSTYTFPNEELFASLDYSREVATVFFDELLRNGTTTALVFCTVFRESANAFFEEARRRNMRMIGGKVLMDRNAPSTLTETVQSGYDDSKQLIERWHGRGRLGYAITPRFAPTSSEGQLRSAASLRQEFPSCLVHSHVAENAQEVEWVRSLFQDRSSYLDVYDHAGLLGPGTVLAHGVQLSNQELDRMGATSTALAHCPTSNTFLGSGLLSIDRVRAVRPIIPVGLGTDVGAGTSFSLLATMGEAYKVAALSSSSIDAFSLFFLATLGGANALGVSEFVGSLEVGKEADVIVLNPHASELLSYRMKRVRSTEEQLFVLATLGDDRSVSATYVAGELAHERTVGAH
jgi:guanine deaminase